MAGKVPADHPPRGMRDLAARLRLPLPLGGHRRQDLLGFPAARVVPVAMARKLPGAGFDKDAVRSRDKAGLIVSRLESELYDYQKELTSKYEQLKASSVATEIMLKHELASQQSTLAETRKREENLKRNLAIQKERISTLEKTLHGMWGETAEVKVSYKAKLAEALKMIETAQKKFNEAEEKLRTAKSLEAECIRTRNASLKSHREDQLRRDQTSFQLENASKEKEFYLLRKSLVLQETIAKKERAEIKRLRQEQEVDLVRRRQEFDTEMETKLASFEEEIDARKALLDQRETAINEQEDAVAQREQNLNLRLAELANKEESLVKKSDELREEEKRLSSEREALLIELQKEKEEIRNMKLNLEKEKSFFEETEDGLKVGKKRLNNALSHGDSEILQPKQKQQKSTTQTVIGGEIDSSCSPSVVEEKYSKNEHDAVPVYLCGKGPHNPQAGELASSVDVLLVNGKSDASDVPEGNKHSKDNSVSAAEPDEDSDDEDEEEKTSTAKKIWRFFIT